MCVSFIPTRPEAGCAFALTVLHASSDVHLSSYEHKTGTEHVSTRPASLVVGELGENQSTQLGHVDWTSSATSSRSNYNTSKRGKEKGNGQVKHVDGNLLEASLVQGSVARLSSSRHTSAPIYRRQSFSGSSQHCPSASLWVKRHAGRIEKSLGGSTSKGSVGAEIKRIESTPYQPAQPVS